MGDMIWIGKKVYIALKNSNRAYSGVILNETEFVLTIRDIRGNLVDISKSEIAFRQEEK
jgi:hypothetical protein